MCQVNVNECHSLIFLNYSITDEICSNINVQKNMIDVRESHERVQVGMNDVNDIIDEICLNSIKCIFLFYLICFKVPFCVKKGYIDNVVVSAHKFLHCVHVCGVNLKNYMSCQKRTLFCFI